MNCPSCNTPNRDDAKFCKGCGQRFSPASAQVPEAVAVNQAQTPAQVNASGAEDPSLAPTLILTPEQMVAFHARRWQQEVEREQSQETTSAASTATDSEDMPTLMSTPIPSSATPLPEPASPQPDQPEDRADMPTMISTPENVATAAENHAEPTPITPPPPPFDPSTAPPAGVVTEAPAAAYMANEYTPATTASTEETAENAATTPEKEEYMTQTPSDQQPVSRGDFPVLAVGSTVNGRYEVSQVVSEGTEEHIYQVIDHQGYQHCWNCGSEQNAEGDEFCIDCGAALLDVSYLMHEYSAAEPKEAEANVLQGAIANTFVEQGHTYVIEMPQVAHNAFPNGVHLLAAGDSDAGNVRRSEPNEDSTLVLQLQRVHESVSLPVGVFVVADGLGGHDNGQVASRMTINIIAERMVRELLGAPLGAEKAGETVKPLDEDALVALLQGAVEDANAALCQMNQRDKTDMGSTLTGFMVVGDHAYVMNVGDSRTYMMRGGQIYQLTTDHSLVGQLVAGGLIQPDDVYTHPQRSQIFRSLGDKLNVQVDIFKQQIQPGDILLSCSDGLWEMVRNPQIESMLKEAPNPQVACTQLIEAANANGGEDNVSAVVVFVQ